MASSNRHWPSMFKSKPCNTHHQWQHHDLNQSLLSSGCHRTPYSSVGGCEERSPEPKPRWNPKPEQIRILEAIFNSGMVNPPRDEIRKIRAQLQEYGQVGDANVFYWFQNRKSRSKHKLRHHNISSKPTNKPSNKTPIITTTTTTTTTTISSQSNNNTTSNTSTIINMSSSLTDNFNVVQDHHYPISLDSSSSLSSHGLCFPHHNPMMVPASTHVAVNNPDDNNEIGGPCTSLNLLSEILNHNHGSSTKDIIIDHDHDDDDHIGAGKLLELNFTPLTSITTMASTSSIAPLTTGIGTDHVHVAVPPISPVIGQLHGVGEERGIMVGPGGGGEGKSTVFINDVAFEVPVGPFNVREAFGEEAVLINSYGHPLLTDEWGLTLHSLHHGAFYYLI